MAEMLQVLARPEPNPSRLSGPLRRTSFRSEPGLDVAFLSADFARLGTDAKAALARSAVRRSFGPNEFVYLQDDEAKHLYFVVSGHVRLSYLMDDGSTVLHGILPAGESFGELGVFENSTYCDMATAIGSLTTASISIQAFRSLRDRHPEIGQALAGAVARRYRSYVTLTRDLSLKSLPARLAQAVLRLADGLKTTGAVQGRRVAILGAVVALSRYLRP